MTIPSWLTGLNMMFPFWAQCVLNPIFRLNKYLPRLCSISALDLCKPSVLTFILYEFKISVPPTLLYGIYVRVLQRTNWTVRTYILCCTVNLINHGASMFVNCTLFLRRSALCRSFWTCSYTFDNSEFLTQLQIFHFFWELKMKTDVPDLSPGLSFVYVTVCSSTKSAA